MNTGLIERVLFACRWLLLPFLLGLVIGLAVLVLRFVKELWEFTLIVWAGSDKEVLSGILSLIELTLIGALIVIVILSIYDNLVSRVKAAGAHPNWPAWIGRFGFWRVKGKLIGIIATIVSVQLLRELESIDDLSDRYLAWLIGMLLAFVLAAFFLALADRLSEGAKDHEGE